MVSGPAFECAASLQATQGAGRLSQSSSLIHSALTMMMQCARFVEDTARHDPSLGVLSLAVLAKTKTSSDADPKMFKLWGPSFPSAEVTSDSNRFLDGIQMPRATGEEGESREIGVNQHTEVEGSRIGSTSSAHLVPDPHRSISSDHLPTLQSPGELFQIEDEFTAKCLSLLMDAAGITSHPISCRYRTLSSIPAAVLISAARAVMEAFKQKNGLSSKFVKYSSLLHELGKELRDSRAQFSSLALLRNEFGFKVVDSSQTVTLSVKKPDRNKKNVHFAMFTALMQIDPQGLCEQQLQEMSKEGLGATGCDAKPGESCGGPHHCSEGKVRSLCDFMDESNSIMGTGEVYPLLSYYRGLPIPMDKFLIRFSSEDGGQSLRKDSFQLWSTCLVSRIDLKNEFGIIVGSAVLYMDKFDLGFSSVTALNVDISEALVVCDIRISSAHKSDPYCFSEWSRFGSPLVYGSQDVHCSGDNISNTLGEFELQTVGFWHRHFVEKQK